MQNFDSDKAARVWQRVRSEEEALPELATLPTLAAQELELARQLGCQTLGVLLMKK